MVPPTRAGGMHWTTGGADAIIALRCREASSQWEAICRPVDRTNDGAGRPLLVSLAALR
jgi:hypothetical protein